MALGGAVPRSASLPPGLPNPTKGQINGKVAVAVSAAVYENDKLQVAYPWGLEAHLTRHDDPDVELVFPCGSWFQPPRGRYRVWLQGEWQMSPYSVLVHYGGGSFRGRGLTPIVPIVEAGLVVLPRAVGKEPGTVLRLLHAGSYLEGKFPRWELSQRRPTSEVRAGLLMPAGRTIGALWDERSQRYTAISRPFEVLPHSTVEVPLERPVGVTHLVIQLQRHALANTANDSAVELLLDLKGREIRPDLEISMADRVYGVWYGLAPGPARLRARSRASFLKPQSLNLLPGRIERLVAQLEGQLVLGMLSEKSRSDG